jgi:hypothetical protein
VLEFGAAEPTDVDDVGVLPGDAPDLGAGLLVDDQVPVDARVGPVAQGGEVGDRGYDRHVEPALRAQPAEQLGAPGIGRDDDVRRDLGDQLAQARDGEPLAEEAGQRDRRGEDGDQPVLQVERPRGLLEHGLGAGADGGPDHPARVAQRVRDKHLRRRVPAREHRVRQQLRG